MTERKGASVFQLRSRLEIREGDFLLLLGETEAVPVEPKAFRVLIYLLRNPGRGN